MNKKKSIFGFILCAGLLFSIGSIKGTVASNAGYGISKLVHAGDGATVAIEGGAGAAGSLGATWLGARIGGRIGAIVGGPIGIIAGAAVGAL